MKKAFTLVELLVVIGILGILIAVLVGTFSGSTESARAAKCLSNMRTLAMAVQNVAMGNTHSYLPFAGSFNKRKKDSDGEETWQEPGWISWSTAKSGGAYISPYSDNRDERELSLTNGTIWASLKKNRDCYVCPTHVKYSKEKRMGDPLWSYAMNAYFMWASKSSFYKDRHGRTYNGFKRSDKYLLFAELPYADGTTPTGSNYQPADDSTAASQANDPVLQYPNCEGDGDEAIGFNHKNGKEQVAHVCFLDGHVEKFRAPRQFTPSDAKNLTEWLCRPVDSNNNQFDVMYNSKSGKYEKVQ